MNCQKSESIGAHEPTGLELFADCYIKSVRPADAAGPAHVFACVRQTLELGMIRKVGEIL